MAAAANWVLNMNPAITNPPAERTDCGNSPHREPFYVFLVYLLIHYVPSIWRITIFFFFFSGKYKNSNWNLSIVFVGKWLLWVFTTNTIQNLKFCAWKGSLLLRGALNVFTTSVLLTWVTKPLLGNHTSNLKLGVLFLVQ